MPGWYPNQSDNPTQIASPCLRLSAYRRAEQWLPPTRRPPTIAPCTNPGTGNPPMSNLIGQSIDTLDTPQLLLDLDIIDANLKRLFAACRERKVACRVHFKSLKCS